MRSELEVLHRPGIGDGEVAPAVDWAVLRVISEGGCRRRGGRGGRLARERGGRESVGRGRWCGYLRLVEVPGCRCGAYLVHAVLI